MATTTVSHTEVPFVVVTDMKDGQLALALSGELDLACTDLLERDEHESDASISDVTVDIAQLDFIDTAGVRALLDVRTRHQAQGRSVELTNPTALVRKVVNLYGRPDLLPAG